ncbi:MAG TPA: hypothetical protein VFW02_11060, partial [Candidatus Limnocylindrales bacterium]|nr:hypothetical protein [Candidatus Limnocylindrales bacterium]
AGLGDDIRADRAGQVPLEEADDPGVGFDVGAIGSAAIHWAAARPGTRVLGLEQFSRRCPRTSPSTGFMRPAH